MDGHVDTSPFLRPFDASFAGTVTDGAVLVLCRYGVDQFSISKIARWMGVTPSALLNDYSRSRLLAIIMATFGDRWLEWSTSSGSLPPTVPRLPETPDELEGVRVWSDLRRLADAAEIRGDPAARVQLGVIDQEEREQLGRRVVSLTRRCCPPHPADVAVLVALTTGLRLDLAATAPGLDVRHAREVLQRGVEALTSHSPECVELRTAS